MIAHDGEAAAALRHIARDEQIKAYALRNIPLYDALLRAARQFIGGETLPQCLAVASTLNGRGFATTIDHMGESTRDAAIARQAADEFRHVIRAIEERGLDASMALSHVDLAVDAGVAFGHAGTLAQAARNAGIELMVSSGISISATGWQSIHPTSIGLSATRSGWPARRTNTCPGCGPYGCSRACPGA